MRPELIVTELMDLLPALRDENEFEPRQAKRDSGDFLGCFPKRGRLAALSFSCESSRSWDCPKKLINF